VLETLINVKMHLTYSSAHDEIYQIYNTANCTISFAHIGGFLICF